MTSAPTVRFFLKSPLRESAAAGKHNFIRLVAEVLENAQYRVEFCDTAQARAGQAGHSLTHMETPFWPSGLTFRRVYQYPFWQIEQTSERWRWDVARTTFDPTQIDPQEAARFFAAWQYRLYGDAPQTVRRDGYIYVPLQGKLLNRRSFQRCSPMDMLAQTIGHNPTSKVIASLHPSETYSKAELAALQRMEKAHSQLKLTTGQMVPLLQGCDYVVTQNSSVAFAGYFFGKPALLFGEIDFHHIAVKADMQALDASFDAVRSAAPDYAAYLWWFWQDQSINAGRPEAKDRIAARFRRFDWAV